MKKNLLLSFAIILAFSTSCNKDNDNPPAPAATDYSNPNNWLVVPTVLDKNVDIFYIYPTAYYSVEPLYADINDQGMRTAAMGHFESQATAFETAGNIFAPVWRQTGLATLDLSMEEQRRINDSIPCYDVLAAFDYYIKHFNGGRPYIIAAHSQGTVQAANILSKYFVKAENQEVYQRMIACYALGYSITTQFYNDHQHVKYARSATDLGVVISYNTEMPGLTGKTPVLLDGAIAINPVNWKTDNTLATAAENLPSHIKNSEGTYVDEPNYADARVNPSRGVVECSTVDPDEHSLGGPFPRGCYHGGDYDFYYYSIRKNAEDRVNAWFNR